MPDSSSRLADWLARIESLSAIQIELGLERVKVVFERLAIEPPVTVLHVAGTNGKSSCVAILEGLLRQSGCSVGCYTSPLLRRYNERIPVDGEDCNDARITAAFERIEAVRGDIPLTYFEYG